MRDLGRGRLLDCDAHGARFGLADGELQLRVLEHALLRVTWRPGDGFREPRTWAIAPTADVPWEGRRRDDSSGFACPAVAVLRLDGGVRVTTDALQVEFRGDPLAISWTDPRGRALAADRPTSAYFRGVRTGAVRHYLARERGERYYGLGDKTGPLDLHGRRLRTLALDSLGYDPEHGDPLYKHWPFVLTRTAQGGWYGIYYDTLAACTFDFGCEHDNYHGLYRYVEIDDGDLDYYLIAGASPAEVIARFVRLIGGTHLPPRWTLGYAQTAMGLTDAPDAQAQLSAFIDRCAQERVPISAFHFGSGYSSRGPRRYVFTWNRDKFPDPRALTAKFRQHGMRLVANIKPCLLDDHPAYAAVRAQNGFVRDAVSGEPVIDQFWDGVGGYLDFTAPAAVAWWQQGLADQLLDYGFDTGWNDNNEYGVMDDAAQCHGFGAALPLHRARPLQPLLMTRASFEAQARYRPGEIPFSVTRAGCPGIQRYAQTWSGDNTTSWATLRWNIRTGLQMSLSGMFNVGHDVGGFAGPVPDPELFVRWVQACCLNPRMVMNSWKADGTVNVPWLYPEQTPLVLAAIALRYRLLPYLWRLFERARDHGEPILRPTFYSFPDDEACYADSDDFLLGDDVLVAPVVTPGAVTRRVYLPRGPQAWIGFASGQSYAAGTTVLVPAPLECLPLFVRAGSVLPLADSDGRLPTHDDPVRNVTFAAGR
ncbi:MAG: glycoside hydrolase family 31 protein [Betaproteobacteria bacterium]|jgi:alpha-glucosidase|nr:glycoside hydrolase family 31 protein [Betaproteobacteria bacterium]